MKTKRSKKDIEWFLNYELHEMQERARRSQHQKIQAQKDGDQLAVSYFETQRDIYRDSAALLAGILRTKNHIPRNIIFLVKDSRGKEAS